MQINKYNCIIICIATQLRQSGMWPEGTNMSDVAKNLLPKDFWDTFCIASWNETKLFELTDDLSLELARKSKKISAFLYLKVLGSPRVTIAEWE